MEKNDFEFCDNYKGKKAIVKYIGSDSVVTIPDGVDSIEAGAFANTDFIDTVVIADSVTCVGFAAFKESSISRITLPQNVTYLGAFVFESCKNLKTVEIQNPNIVFSRSPFKDAADDYEILFGGTCAQFKNAANRAFCREGECQSGDYYHPSATRFEYYKYTEYEHIFSNTLSAPFTCKVKCSDGELVFHEMPYERWIEKC